ncbi:amino acid adenylation domain-containing protein [Dactylosporangium sp. NPDC051541]|uniref:amino acid adenylation domain-containing protein n=1 Tax=Dactylosporangium sp. NPDC051541 TaxID=3363977 RepID=UPI0037962679
MSYSLPASFAQERLWFLAQLDPGVPQYNLNVLTQLPGRIDPDRLQRAFAAVVRRHETLRTALAVQDGALVQLIEADPECSIARSDLGAVPAERREAAFDRLARADASEPFTLDRAPLWRARLVRLADDDWRLVHVIHHAVFDGYSAGNFDAELLECYTALDEGRPPRLPDLPIQYADYAAWQRRQFTDGQLDHWRAALAGLPADIGLPTDRPRPARRRYAGDEHRLTLPPAVGKGLRLVAQQHGATLFMTLLAGYAALLSRVCGHTDIVVGTPVAGRGLPELGPVIGMLTNLLVLRIDAAGDPTFRELLGRVRGTVLDALDHQDVPFEKVVEALQPQRDLSRPALYQAGFNLLPGERRGQFGNGTAKMDLDLEVVDSGDTLDIWLYYDTELFDAATIARLADNLALLLAAAVADPGTQLHALPVTTPAELADLDRFGRGRGPGPAGTVLEAFRAQVARSGPATAVVSAAGTLTYAELDARSDRVARHLRAAGVGPGHLVALTLPRSLDLHIAVWGVLKSGAGFVPLDPEHPEARTRFVLADAAVSAVLDSTDVDGPPSPLPDASAGDLAYVIYTSGSTGRPKGVEVEHRALRNLLDAIAGRLGSGDSDVWLHLTTPAFDISLLEMLLPVATGGRVVIAETVDPAALCDLVRRHAVTHVQAVPTTWRLMLDAGFAEPSVTALAGGEAVPLELAQALRGRVRRLFNVYGPTETTIWSAMRELTSDADLGGPLAGTSLHVLDATLRPVPIGVVGELCIGGTGVARGYRRRPALTAERFVPDPSSDTPGSRLYRTGDLARWRPDGRLEFRGRADHQVKVRGYRVELGEIESVLETHPGVARAAAAVHDTTIYAYLVPHEGPPPPDAELRAHLARALPAYMLPAAFVAVEGLPMTPNGKLDRAALAAPDPADAAAAAHVAPRTTAEEYVAGIWTEVLGVDNPGVHDEFFAIGGHSVLAARVAARLRAAFDIEVPLSLLFVNTTIEQIAAALEELLAADSGY